MAGRVWSIDALYDNGAMSMYATLTTASESPLVEGLLYTGSDDGLVQVSENGGGDWRAVETLPGVPELSFVNDIEASLHDSDTVFAALDAHQTGVFRPLLFESSDRGRTWRSITGNLPDRTIVWAIAQDHLDPDLLFIGTEFGLYFTPDRGRNWIRLEGGVPTISFRDVKIQRRENDVVGATFGRGFYVLDDYSSLRDIADGALDKDAALFPVRDAWWYVPSVPGQAAGKPSLGSDDYAAANPPFGAALTYFLKEGPKSSKKHRQEREKELRENAEDVPFPGWETLQREALEQGPMVLLTVRDAQGRAVRRIEGPAEAGIHRVSWDLRLPPADPIELAPPAFMPPWWDPPRGPFAAPGTYQVELALLSSGGLEPLAETREFEVKPLAGFSLGEPDFQAVTTFQAETAELYRQVTGAAEELQRIEERLPYLRRALRDTPQADPVLFAELDAIRASLASLRLRLIGDQVRGQWNEPSVPTIRRRVGQVAVGHWDTRQAPTSTQRQSLEVARSEFAELLGELSDLLETELPTFEAKLEAAGAAWTPGRKLPD